MLQTESEVKQEEVKPGLVNMCDQLIKTWADDLSAEEKEIWLWNALIEIKKIQKRRKM
jgi:hypothetical protein